MGDRANLVIAYQSTGGAKKLGEALPGSLVLYTHSGGYELGPALAVALRAAAPRWSDGSYAARIIVSHVVGEEWKSEYGHGLLVGEVEDNERAVRLVDFERRLVVRFGEPGEYLSPRDCADARPTAEWTFEQFASFSDEEARIAHLGR